MLARDLSGTEVLTAFADIEPLGWKVFVEQPVAEVYATLNATILRTGALMVAGLLFSVLTALWLARGLVRPIRTLQEGAQRIGAGELDQRIEVQHRRRARIAGRAVQPDGGAAQGELCRTRAQGRGTHRGVEGDTGLSDGNRRDSAA